MLFRLLAGRHTENKKVYAKDDIIDTKHDLVAMFGDNKFERLTEAGVSATPQLSATKKKKKSKSKLADVTKDFPDAEVNDFLVFKKGRKFFVAEKDNPDEFLNEEGLSAADVDGFVDDQFEEE